MPAACGRRRSGEAVLPHARAALAAVAAIRSTVDDLTGLVRGHVAMGVVTSYDVPDVPALLGDFRERHPGVEITLDRGEHRRPGRRAARRVARPRRSSRLPAAPVDGLETHVVTRRRARRGGRAGATSSPGATSLPVRELRDLPLISLPRGTGLRVAARRCLRGRRLPSANRARGGRPGGAGAARGARAGGRDRPRVAGRRAGAASCTRSRSRGRSCAGRSPWRGGRGDRRAPPGEHWSRRRST